MTEPTPTTVPGVPDLWNKRNGLTVAAIVAVVWISAAMIGHWAALVGAAVLTATIAGGLWWLWRKQKKQMEILQLLQRAQGSPEARQAALRELAASGAAGDKDAAVLAGLAQAQLQAQSDPDAALETLAAMDLSKLPQDAADQVRTLQAHLLLIRNRSREARSLADVMAVPATGPLAGRAMTAAVIAEAYARTGRPADALPILEPFPPDHPELGEVRPILLFARVFAFFGANKPERARKDMKALLAIDMNLLGRFVAPGPGVHIDLRKMATELLRADPQVRKMAMRPPPGAMAGRRQR